MRASMSFSRFSAALLSPDFASNISTPAFKALMLAVMGPSCCYNRAAIPSMVTASMGTFAEGLLIGGGQVGTSSCSSCMRAYSFSFCFCRRGVNSDSTPYLVQVFLFSVILPHGFDNFPLGDALAGTERPTWGHVETPWANAWAKMATG